MPAASCPGTTADRRQAWSRLNPALPLPPNTLAAINHEYVDLGAPVRGDELAFFPPVTGG